MYIYNETLFSHKKKKILSLGATQRSLEIIILNEIRQAQKRQIPYEITFQLDRKNMFKSSILYYMMSIV
jgi:hypothetical protein